MFEYKLAPGGDRLEKAICQCNGVGMGSLPARMAGSAAHCRIIMMRLGPFLNAEEGTCERGADDCTVSTLEVEYSPFKLAVTVAVRAT